MAENPGDVTRSWIAERWLQRQFHQTSKSLSTQSERSLLVVSRSDRRPVERLLGLTIVQFKPARLTSFRFNSWLHSLVTYSLPQSVCTACCAAGSRGGTSQKPSRDPIWLQRAGAMRGTNSLPDMQKQYRFENPSEDYHYELEGDARMLASTKNWERFSSPMSRGSEPDLHDPSEELLTRWPSLSSAEGLFLCFF